MLLSLGGVLGSEKLENTCPIVKGVASLLW
uniref:Uncharacterized protein n=1 Tax=Anguilla anguilla TaxID=7936 RepID=A0A0E9QLI7_ANGAN